MPTGYTCDVKDGKITTFRAFALQCARAFGALVLMRDDPLDAVIPERFEPSDYHEKELAKAKARLAELETMTTEQAAVIAHAEHESAMQSYLRCEDVRKTELARYERMLAMVQQWTPPTKDHVGLKKFMIEQLQSSIEFDCRPSDQPAQMSAEEWLKAAKKQAQWHVEYHTRNHAEEIARARERTQWVADLRASLANEPQPS